MSVVVVKLTSKEIIIGSDSIVVYGGTQDKSINSHSKLIQVNGMIIGSVGICEEAALFQTYCLTRKPSRADQESILSFVSEFVSWKKEKTGAWGIQNSYILLFCGRAFSIQNFFIEEILTHSAIGAGMDYALTALHLGHSVEKSIEVACELCIYCEKPIKVFTMSRNNNEGREIS